MKLFITLVLFLLNLTCLMGSTEYLLTSQDPAFVSQLSAHAQTSYREGRIWLVKLNRPFDEIPTSLKKNLQQIDRSEILIKTTFRNPKTATSDPQILKVISEVNASNIAETIKALSGLEKRGAATLDKKPNSGNKQAQDYITQAFIKENLQVESHCYRTRIHDDECNIVGIKNGIGATPKNIIIVAHLDAVSHDFAGADDNASGIAGLVEMARVIKNVELENNVIFVAVNAEEIGLIGSTQYVAKLKKEGTLKNISHVIVMDMIGYNRGDNIFNIETGYAHAKYAEWIADQSLAYTNLKPSISIPAWGSDHVPFLEEKIPTYLAIEDWDNHNSCYHQACDVIDNVNMDYAAEIIKLNLAVLLQNHP